MPIFEYKCPKCGRVFEILWRRGGVLDYTGCPDCHVLCPKILSKFNFQFSPYLKELGEDKMISY